MVYMLKFLIHSLPLSYEKLLILFGAHIQSDGSLTVFQRPLHLSELTVNPSVSLSGFKPISVGLVMHGWLFQDIHVVKLETCQILLQ